MLRCSRREWLAGTAATTALLAAPRAARAANATRWTIEPSEAHDAIRLISYGGYPVGAGPLEKDAALSALARSLPADAVKHVLGRFGYVFLDVFEPLLEAFDFARPRTLGDLRGAITVAAPHAPKWFAQSAGDLERIVDALIAGGFSAYWRENNLPRADAGAARLRLALGDADPFTPASRILGTPSGEDVTILVQGYADRDWYWLAGRRFYVRADAKPADVLRYITDNLVRDGYPLRDDAEVNRAIDALAADRFIAGTLKARNSHHEYWASPRSYVHGNCISVLQQLAGGPPLRMYWRGVGINVFAEALYAVLVDERYTSTAHGPFRATLLRLIGPDGPLAPGRVGPTYARLIGAPPPPRWAGEPPLPDPAHPR